MPTREEGERVEDIQIQGNFCSYTLLHSFYFGNVCNIKVLHNFKLNQKEKPLKVKNKMKQISVMSWWEYTNVKKRLLNTVL